MKLLIVVFFAFISLESFSINVPLFSKEELLELEYLKSTKFLEKQRSEELKNYAIRVIRFQLETMSKWEKKYLIDKYHKKFWGNFDETSDNELRKKIMFDLIFKDLYKKEEVENVR